MTDQRIVDLAFKIRTVIDKPMVLLQDSCAPDSPDHSEFSLHRWGIDHTASAKAGRLVEDRFALGKAIDFYFIDPDRTPMEMLRDFLSIRLTDGANGVGIYPDWRPYPGFHVDCRSITHPGCGAHWIGYMDARRRQRYRYSPKLSDLSRFIERGFRPNGERF